MPAANPPGHSISLTGLEWKDEVATVHELSLDATYQRHVVERLVSVIANDYNPILAGKLIVSRRNGTTYIVDGQQRWHGAREAGIDDIGVIAIYGLDQEAEAKLFLALNEGRVAVRAIDNFRAAFVSNTPYAVDIVDIVEAKGGRIAGIRQPPKETDVAAVEALRWIYKRGGRKGLEETLDIIVAAFGELSKQSCPGLLVKGVFAVLSLHHEELDTQRLARQVGKTGVNKLTSMAHGMGQLLGAAAGQRSYYLAVLGAYNERLHAKAIDPAGTLNRVAKQWQDDNE